MAEQQQQQQQQQQQPAPRYSDVPYIVGHGAILMNVSGEAVSAGEKNFPHAVPIVVRPVTAGMQDMLDEKVLVIA